MAKDITWETYGSQIESISKLDFNYDEKVYHDTLDKKGWFIDQYQATLANEGPGEPKADGPFMRARNAIRLYQFPNPRLIRAYFNPDAELVNRNMLLAAKFLGFKFYFGVRVTRVIDEIRKNEIGEDLNVWGYSYRTLKGHFELGEILFEVNKNLKTGDVVFEMKAYSKPDRIPNIFYRIGFKIFGRFLQRSFARQSIRRLKNIAQGDSGQLV